MRSSHAQRTLRSPRFISRPRAAIALAIAAITVATGTVTLNSATAVSTSVQLASAQTSATALSRAAIAAERQITVHAKTAAVEFAGLKVVSVKLAVKRAAVARETSLRTAVVKLAKAQLGDSYVRGGSGPSRFDCSGLVRYVMKNAVGKELPHSSRAMWGKVKKINRSKAKPGDLVFFFRGGAHHVGIYIGGGKMVDARNPRDDVRVSPIARDWWARAYSGMGRVIPAV